MPPPTPASTGIPSWSLCSYIHFSCCGELTEFRVVLLVALPDSLIRLMLCLEGCVVHEARSFGPWPFPLTASDTSAVDPLRATFRHPKRVRIGFLRSSESASSPSCGLGVSVLTEFRNRFCFKSTQISLATALLRSSESLSCQLLAASRTTIPLRN